MTATRALAAGFTTLLCAAAAEAVGLGPLAKAGNTDGPAKAFYLTLYNPYPNRTEFQVYAIGNDDEAAQPRVHVPAGPLPLAGARTRKFMIVATGLAPGETYAFRICAEKANDKDEPIHARVCSRITARRLAPVA